MKQKLISVLFAALSLFAVSQGVAHAGVERTANIWLLTPASWHPDPSKIDENYPFDINEDKGEKASDWQTGVTAPQHQHHTATVAMPAYHQQ